MLNNTFLWIYCLLLFHSTAGVLTIPYSAVLLFTEVSWLFSPSPSPQSSHAGSVLCLTRLVGRPFSPAASADVSVTVSMECVSLFISPSGFSQRKDAHSPCIPSCLVHLKMRVSVQTVSGERDRQRGVNNLAQSLRFLLFKQTWAEYRVMVPPSGCPADRKLTWQH